MVIKSMRPMKSIDNCWDASLSSEVQWKFSEFSWNSSKFFEIQINLNPFRLTGMFQYLVKPIGPIVIHYWPQFGVEGPNWDSLAFIVSNSAFATIGFFSSVLSSHLGPTEGLSRLSLTSWSSFTPEDAVCVGGVCILPSSGCVSTGL